MVLKGIAHRIHRQLHGALALKPLQKATENDGEGPVDPSEFEAALANLQERRLVQRIGSRYLALAVRGEMPSLPKANEGGYPGGWINRSTNHDSIKNERLGARAETS